MPDVITSYSIHYTKLYDVDNNPWPYWPNTLRTSSSHKEGCERRWSLNTKRFIGENGQLKQVEIVQVEWKQEAGRWMMNEVEGTRNNFV